MRVAITGAAGYIGRQVIQRLEDDGGESIIGISRRKWNHQFSTLDYHSLDVRSSALPKLLEKKNVDAVVHLAFVVNPLHDEKEM
ncbi:MAG: NAD-dependent epimerase/dehydratase family protein, partial [Candidatus Thermoplasmatota archaeon]|nr:NAD-dependent epimerase/dehydratase family protein [Candidatus Thermoplasmatota archaeon]